MIDKNDTAKIGDFGSSKPITEKTVSMQGHTTRYCAPEAIHLEINPGVEPPSAVDVWSLGCIIVHMASGNKPYHTIAPHTADESPLAMSIAIFRWYRRTFCMRPVAPRSSHRTLVGWGAADTQEASPFHCAMCESAVPQRAVTTCVDCAHRHETREQPRTRQSVYRDTWLAHGFADGVAAADEAETVAAAARHERTLDATGSDSRFTVLKTLPSGQIDALVDAPIGATGAAFLPQFRITVSPAQGTATPATYVLWVDAGWRRGDVDRKCANSLGSVTVLRQREYKFVLDKAVFDRFPLAVFTDAEGRRPVVPADVTVRHSTADDDLTVVVVVTLCRSAPDTVYLRPQSNRRSFVATRLTVRTAAMALCDKCDREAHSLLQYPGVLQQDQDAQRFLSACFRRPDDPPEDGKVLRRATCEDLARMEHVFHFVSID